MQKSLVNPHNPKYNIDWFRKRHTIVHNNKCLCTSRKYLTKSNFWPIHCVQLGLTWLQLFVRFFLVFFYFISLSFIRYSLWCSILYTTISWEIRFVDIIRISVLFDAFFHRFSILLVVCTFVVSCLTQNCCLFFCAVVLLFVYSYSRPYLKSV